MNNHPIHSKNEDKGCAWLCLSAGMMSRGDERQLEQALAALGSRPAKQVPYVDMLARVK